MERKRGTICSINRGKGYGFIVPDDKLLKPENYLFFPTVALVNVNNVKDLRLGQGVSYIDGQDSIGRPLAMGIVVDNRFTEVG